MTALTAKANISGSPSRATANAGFGALWDYINERFAAGTATAAEKAATRAALEAGRLMSAVSVSVASNELIIAIKPNAKEFRSATLADGAVTMLANAGDLTLVVPSGATLGTSSGVAAKLAILELNNAGTKEAAIVNLAGSVDLSESGVISTSAMSTGADAANVVYSGSARSNVPYRIVGFIEITQASAGVWASDPSLVDCSSAPLAKWLTGYGQRWQDMTSSRAGNTDYTNTTGRNIKVQVFRDNVGPSASLSVDGLPVSTVNPETNVGSMAAADVPPGSVYRFGGVFNYWVELR